MEVVEPTELMRGLRRVDLSSASTVELRRVLDAIRCVRARFDLVEAEVARRLQSASATPERDIAKSAQRSNRHGSKVIARAAALAESAPLTDALESGQLDGGHVDVFAKVLGSLEGSVKAGFEEAAPGLIEAAAASGSTPEEFAGSLHAAAEQIASDGGMTRFERQRRATRLRTWTDRATGMWRLSGAFDPESGARMHGRLEAAMAAMFAVKAPSTTPTDPGEKQDHLRALALLTLTCDPGVTWREPSHVRPHATAPQSPEDGDQSDPGRGADRTSPSIEWDAFGDLLASESRRFGRPEFTMVIDTTALGPDGKPIVDWGIPVHVPWSRVQDLCRSAIVRPVIVQAGEVIDAGGELNLGRTSRLANRAQRRALRAVYATCAVPGCSVSFNHTKPHHVHWWRQGGTTDLANLLPLCSSHHHAAHEGGWRFALGPNRDLVIELPGGEVMKTGPPRRQLAAA